MSRAWPSALPQAMLRSGHSRKLPANYVSTPMSVGPSKRRRRGSAKPKPFTGSYDMTASQFEVFEEFYETTLAYGTLTFDWPGPDGTETTNSRTRFVAGTEPEVVPSGFGWTVKVQLEVLP